MDERVVEDEETDRRRGEPEAGELPGTGRRGRAMTPGAGGERNGGGRAIVRHARHRLSRAPRRHPEIAVDESRERAVVVARFYGRRQANRYVSRMDRSGS